MARWPAGGSGRCGRGLGAGVATLTSAAGTPCHQWAERAVREQVLDLVAGQLDQSGRRRIAGLERHLRAVTRMGLRLLEHSLEDQNMAGAVVIGEIVWVPETRSCWLSCEFSRGVIGPR
jgi:hypothetical protein